MKIAVLMSTYNGHNFLKQQLDSLSRQTVSQFMTVYIRDDGSTDDTLEIINKYKDKLDIVVYSEANVGPANSFWSLLVNRNIEADYYAFCDQDDVWDEDKLEISISKLSEGYCLYACNSRIIDEKGNVMRNQYISFRPQIDIERLFIAPFAQGCCMAFTNELRCFILGLNLTCISMHDSMVMRYAYFYGRIYWDQRPHFSYRMHSNNVVAKENKTVKEKILITYRGWKTESLNSKSIVAEEILKNITQMKSGDFAFLVNVANYKNSIRSKYTLITSKKRSEIPKSSIRSFKLRVLLNLF